RDRKFNRPVADHGHRASMEPTQVQPREEAPAEQPRAPQPHHHPKQDRAPKPHKQQHDQKPKQQNNEPKKPDAHQLPAFLLRPVKVPPAKPAKPKAEAEN
ncbi:MAG TPA: hypothetical protein VG867_10350, partial [Rhizomicrobium sp.]|nr:hypothetical protein [Rhizomicrobium sp.]